MKKSFFIGIGVSAASLVLLLLGAIAGFMSGGARLLSGSSTWGAYLPYYPWLLGVGVVVLIVGLYMMEQGYVPAAQRPKKAPRQPAQPAMDMNYAQPQQPAYDQSQTYGGQGYDVNQPYGGQSYDANQPYGNQGYDASQPYGGQGYDASQPYGGQGYDANQPYGGQGYDPNQK